MNRQMKRMMERQGQIGPDGEPVVAQREPASRPNPNIQTKRKSPLHFFGEVKLEMKKVNWPSRKDTINYSIIVFVTLVVLIGLIFLLDLAFGGAANFLFK